MLRAPRRISQGESTSVRPMLCADSAHFPAHSRNTLRRSPPHPLRQMPAPLRGRAWTTPRRSRLRPEIPFGRRRAGQPCWTECPQVCLDGRMPSNQGCIAPERQWAYEHARRAAMALCGGHDRRRSRSHAITGHHVDPCVVERVRWLVVAMGHQGHAGWTRDRPYRPPGICRDPTAQLSRDRVEAGPLRSSGRRPCWRTAASAVSAMASNRERGAANGDRRASSTSVRNRA